MVRLVDGKRLVGHGVLFDAEVLGRCFLNMVFKWHHICFFLVVVLYVFCSTVVVLEISLFEVYFLC